MRRHEGSCGGQWLVGVRLGLDQRSNFIRDIDIVCMPRWSDPCDLILGFDEVTPTGRYTPLEQQALQVRVGECQNTWVVRIEWFGSSRSGEGLCSSDA